MRTSLSGLSLVFLSTVALACSPDFEDGSSSGFANGSGGSGGGDSSGKGGDSSSSSNDGGSTSSNPVQQGPTGTAGDDTSSSSGGGPPCAAGTIQCDGNTKQVCDGNGGFTDVEECAPGVCVAEVGCTVCAPNAGTCNGNVSTVCRADGSGFDDYVCDPEQGVTCDAASGHCMGACAPEQLGTSYIGCDYFPTVSVQEVSDLFNFAVAIANTSDEAANVKITRGGVDVVVDFIDPNSVKVINLPWVQELKTASASLLVPDGAYRLRTTRPVTVYQYSPLEYQNGFGASYTNDASLLLPTNAWTGNYRVAARNTWLFAGSVVFPGFYSVIASQDGTTVTLGPSATGMNVTAGGGVAQNGTGTIILNEGDVLQVLSGLSGGEPDASDLTGTLVTADKPVEVLAGSKCTNIPYNVTACDHLEEFMPPIETLRTEYIVTPPLIPTGGTTPKAQMVRVIATEAATTITYDPPQAGAPTSLANPGDYFEIPQTLADFVITGDKPILVSQYMQGQDAGGGSGDPAMALAVATEQYRAEYLFHAPTNYETNYVNITAPTAATITLDGAAVSGFVPIGASGYGVARLPLNNAGDGNHYITGTQPFGISVYGYGQYTSYWYPGGLDLDKGTN